ncbi:Eukaryotic translation initiation factor 3 subunit A [Rhynchospora pubera]|uniref:Eukaryotic translation initiation factor 3 subunit A n=1 Tax=Rhynchospora pubera TaxID=906938 RepID=A0AAV8FRG8_9POAL|nr:Eukaryotic translation initiation factor 3 subunit A [Rhynchospora pubera]KAJ4818018.1 Eukaryotic translation initiation factor 3 subunit A [Rhynchospora pubera]
MATFAKPENALKRAEELINVGQKQAALQALHDLITSKRYRAWQKTLEKIMFKYVELCVDMRKGRFAKDGLIQYRIVCQQVNVSSLEEVIKHFMHLSTERAEQARSQAEALEEALDVDDLEMDKRPEDLMLSFVSGEKGKDRSDRELVTPWFKFLWETYRTVLEILRNNSKLEALYAMTAHRAFQFCKTYKRTTEFRRLCEIIRNHLANLNKYRDQRDRPDLTAPESLQLYLDTRMEQLKIATELDLWQEAFRSVEDIHGLMTLVKKSPKPSLMVIYYAKLTEIFWVADSHLYHAYAWLKLFGLQKSYNKNLSQKDLQLIAASVLLAALSVPPYDHKYGASHLELENYKDRNLRMAGLINFTLDAKRESREVLSRASLLSELTAKGVMSCVPQEVKDIYNLLENEFLPLDLASRVQPLLSKIAKLGGKLSTASAVPEVQLSQYIPALEKLTALRVLKQAAQVFQTMKIDMLSKMIPFFDFAVVEKIAVDAVKYNFVAMKVDHLKGSVIFGNVDIEADTLCDHLTKLTESLNKVWYLIHPPAPKQSKLGEKLYHLSEIVETEHKRLLARKSIIEKRKEEHERQMLEMEREEESKRLKMQKITQEAEQRRLEVEYREREQARIRKEIAEKEMQEAQALLEAQRRKGKGKKPLIEGEMTKQTLIELALSEQLKERQEMEKKLQKLAKTMDHLERARRENESPLIEQAWQKRLDEERIRYEQEQLRAIEESKKNHAEDLRRKTRLSRMLEHVDAMRQKIDERRQAEFGQVMKEREDRITQRLAMRRMERDRMRKLIFFITSEEERITRLRQEEEARKREEEERKKKEEAEKKAKLDAVAELQRQRQREIEERDAAAAAAVAVAAPPVAAPAAAAPAATAPAAAAPAAGRYVPRFRRGGSDAAPPQRPAAAPEPDRWNRPDDRPPAPSGGDRWRGSRGGGESRLPSSSANSWSASRNRG